MIRDISKGIFGSITAGGTFWATFDEMLSPAIRIFVGVMGAFVVFATYRGILLTNRQKRLELILKNAELEHAERKLCDECRAGRVPVRCPFPSVKRPANCPHPELETSA